MRINFDESDLMTIGMDEDEANHLARQFRCKIGDFQLSTWESPYIMISLEGEDIQPIVDKIIRRIAGGEEGYLLCRKIDVSY